MSTIIIVIYKYCFVWTQIVALAEPCKAISYNNFPIKFNFLFWFYLFGLLKSTKELLKKQRLFPPETLRQLRDSSVDAMSGGVDTNSDNETMVVHINTVLPNSHGEMTGSEQEEEDL